ncbi:competence type IV pilus assembly protein ComGB [Bacillus sp. FJAT-49736]|uniref:competence type IV pilus assembly protein ComGB n=1 Tax=Bacillus sp. FJAT-49736 TaxID=2833582 RepID=UPI001BCA231D|nr:competence type IV pilus assembly protein ComGB [Bacillus sp. FJAT-49736]MBS4173455.1 type II secretion system F family protein [Bacillus sp. FJAT-49736]
MFLTRLGEMLQNGFSLAEAIEFLGRIDKNIYSLTSNMLKKFQEGIAIHEIFSEEQFDKKACAQIYFAEKHGNLAIALAEAGKYLLKRDKERKTLWKLLQYPLVLVGILILILFMLKNILLPQFTDLYTSLDYHPSSVIQFFAVIMENGPRYFFVFSVSVFLFIPVSYIFFKKWPPIKRAEWIARIPIIQQYYKLFNSQFLARECSFLLQSGFSINEILVCIASQNYRPLLKNVAEIIRKDLTVGLSFSDSLKKFSFYDKQLISIIQHGEKNGKLDQEMLFFSRYCLGLMEDKMEKVFKLLQPIMFIIVGLLVLAVYMSIMLPMFDMLDSI